jgi:hypothetical protein
MLWSCDMLLSFGERLRAFAGGEEVAVGLGAASIAARTSGAPSVIVLRR